LRDVSNVSQRWKIEIKNYSAKLERATGIEPLLPAWESISGALYFQYLQNGSARITVQALPDLRVAGGRLGTVYA
jgi:hypothetical protein